MTTDCEPGTFQPAEGQTECLIAPLGTYVDVTRAISFTECPVGTTTLVEGAASIDACLGGRTQTEILRDDVAALLPTGDRKVDRHLEKALESLDDSLDPDFWAGDTALDPDRGKKVFDEHKKAAKDLEKARDAALGNTGNDGDDDDGDQNNGSSPSDPVLAAAIEVLIGDLVAIDRSLAAAAIDAVDCTVAATTKDQRKCERNLDKAETSLADGDAAFAEAQSDGEDYDEAIKDYKKAWKKAIKASEKAGAPLTAASTASLPETLALHAAYPNPLTHTATLPYDLPEATHVTLTVYDVLGRTVATLVDGTVEAGTHTATLDGARLAAGTYVVRLVTGTGEAQTQRLTVVR